MDNKKAEQQILDEFNAMRLELEETRFKLYEATDIIEAIRSGEIDALVVKNGHGHQLFTLKSSDQTYRIFIEQMTEGAVTLNHDMNIVYSNSRFAALVGMPLEKVIGQPFCRFVTPEHESYCPVLISKAWQHEQKGELTLFGSNHEQVPVLVSLKTLDLDEGLSMSVIITDLSEQMQTQKLLLHKNEQLEDAQKHTQHLNANLENTVRERTKELEINIQHKNKIEQDLRSNQERLTRVLETMAEGVGIIDLAGNLTYANPMAQKLLGLKPDKLFTTSFYDPEWQTMHLDGTRLAPEEHPLNMAIITGKPVYDYEIAVRPDNKNQYYISVNAAPLYNDKGVITGAVGTFMDVTNRRMQQQQKDDFISIASHELKTPITSLKASLQLLNRLKNNPTAKMLPNLIDQANKSMERISTLIEDLLNVSHINDGQLHLQTKKINLAQLIDSCCQQARMEGMPIIITGNRNLEVYGDADKIEQVIVNFTNNAAKYAPLSKEICIDITLVNDMARVAVTDQGPGIPAENLPHLFDRYYRVENNGIRYSGLGLGLYISAEIIKKHGGKIGVDSKIGEGSTFWFMLPAK